MIRVRLDPSSGVFSGALAADVQGASRAGLLAVVMAIESHAVRLAPRRTSNLVNTITSHVNAQGTVGEVRATARYAFFVHEGTGLYGPHKQRIVPTTKKALWWPGAQHPVRSTRGIRGRPFFTLALGRIDPQSAFDAGASAYLKMRRS